MTMFPTFIARDVFSELNGFALCAPDALDRLHDGDARGLDLIELYTTTDLGDRASANGAAIPLFDLETGEYTLVVRHSDSPTLLRDRRVSSPGWVLHAGPSPLALCGIGYLHAWTPDHPKVRRVAVPPGWYTVEVLCGLGATSDEWLIELVLRPSEAQPAFTADMSLPLNFTSPP